MVETVEGAPDDTSVYNRPWSEQTPRAWRDGGWRESQSVPGMTIMAGAAPEPAPEPAPETVFADAYTVS
eukprot:SAG31_NODE_19590_length_597_cov_1.835341_1_plen_68_part_10